MKALGFFQILTSNQVIQQRPRNLALVVGATRGFVGFELKAGSLASEVRAQQNMGAI